MSKNLTNHSYHSYHSHSFTTSTSGTSDYTYKLEKGSKKHICPECNHKTLVRYVDGSSDNYLPSQYGRCDREVNCGYSRNPYKDGYAKEVYKEKNSQNAYHLKKTISVAQPVQKSKTLYSFPESILYKTNKGYDKNGLIQNLLNQVDYPFSVEDLQTVIEQYYLGTITKGYRAGAITFPFINYNNKVMTIQVKQFDIKNHSTSTDFLHSMMVREYDRDDKVVPEWLKKYCENESKVNCLFGEHLLTKYPKANIALVEAPKTAIYGTLHFGFPEETNMIWLAVYNLSSLNLKKCRALANRNVILFPDLSKGGTAYNKWSTKIELINKELNFPYFKVSRLLEDNAQEEDREKGMDLADYLIKLDWRLLRKKEVKEIPKPASSNTESSTSEKGEVSESNIFSKQIKATAIWEGLDDLTQYFWNNGRGGEEGYLRHKKIMSGYGC